MIETIDFGGTVYPKFQSEGFAAKFAFPYALQVCKGIGYDIGCNREEWKLPGAIGIDPMLSGNKTATNLPPGEVDYIFSSHCLEHIDNWVSVLDYWYLHLKAGGVLFLYLPHYSQAYWRPWSNRKHVNIFTAEFIRDYLINKGYNKIFASEMDLNNSFMIMAEK